MALVPLTQGHYGLIVLFLVWGVAGFGMMAPQQSRLAALSPAQAPILLSINTSMLYFGIGYPLSSSRQQDAPCLGANHRIG